MTDKYIESEVIDERILKVIIKRPEKGNALSREVLDELVSFFESLEDKRKIIIITGSGDKFFSAGADIKSLYDKEVSVLDFHKFYRVIEEYPYPVIAMINGYCFGAACELIATCDIRVASENAVLGMPPARLGQIYSYEGILKFIRLVGWGKTKFLFLTGARLTAEEAHKMGLIDYLVPDNILESFTIKLARDILKNAPLSLIGLKKIIEILGRHVLNNEELKEIEKYYRLVLDSKDMEEGLKAFLEKREPKYSGK